jgi:hypothetical protein
VLEWLSGSAAVECWSSSRYQLTRKLCYGTAVENSSVRRLAGQLLSDEERSGEREKRIEKRPKQIV